MVTLFQNIKTTYLIIKRNIFPDVIINYFYLVLIEEVEIAGSILELTHLSPDVQLITSIVKKDENILDYINSSNELGISVISIFIILIT